MFGLDSEYPVLYNILYVLYIYLRLQHNQKHSNVPWHA